jgi:hypothetical protein
MQLSHPIILPLLIREILDHYMYYLPHRERMKRLNQDYKNNVDNQVNYLLIWRPTSKLICMIHPLRPQRSIRCYREQSRRNIPEKIFRLPPKFKYSSGLNHPNGYKFKQLFSTSKMMFFDYITHNKKPNKSTEPDYYNNPDY